ncbi:hypothetical protein AIOL_001068 [Candidatus Rhodobacter oscarellae]|uniref:Uncharacterized protein n=1 Tax=Candidatus Rhodobacter oscarellae TaxID=1675527 RepID=A0A0J9DZN2_9RHOB|nr:hypothetical protein [Candidatus Rhodobacter lobularis]KMW56116.1 hypothetical protein AIOL_001068 [Candidatus Rhodobacter lobularis]
MHLTLHLGVHRSASTLIDKCLAKTALASPQAGLRVWQPGRLRRMEGFSEYARHFDGRGQLRDKDAAVAAGLAEGALRDAVAAEVKAGTRHLFVSEENILGSMGRNLQTARAYPKARARLLAHLRLFQPAPSRIAIGLRDYAAFWQSSYAYLYARSGGETPCPDGAAILEQNSGWGALIDVVRGVWPGAEIMLWQQERLGGALRQICARLASLPQDIIQLVDKRLNASKPLASLGAVFSTVQRQALEAQYKSDIAEMRCRGDVTWLDEEK